MKHFQELWVDAENCEPLDTQENIIKEIKIKIELYDSIKHLDDKTKEQALGELLYSIAKLSKTDNINVYTGLRSAIVKRLIV
ncbi:MAG: hypothetical protein LC122_12615 [Chitinophagales bacterium]|nr:hypothetical protein [Chitinophagales bacterium]